MDLDQLKLGWQKSKSIIAHNVHLTKEEMEAIIKKQANKTTYRLSRIFIMGMITQSLTLIFLVLSGVKYWHTSDLFIIICTSILPISFALFYSWNRYTTLRDANFDSMSISDSLAKKIKFYKFSYNKWLLSYALSFIFFLWSINMLAGDFTSLSSLNPRLLLVYLACFLTIYFSYRYAHSRYLREYEICLSDLGGERVTDMEAISKKFNRFKLVLIIILFAVMLAGIFLLLT